jgi:endonuclease III-like uncharacterized protein
LTNFLVNKKILCLDKSIKNYNLLLLSINYYINLFVIDSYTRRLFFRLGLVEKDISYDELQDFISSNIPNNTKIYQEFHALIVVHCKNVCKKSPSCSMCVLKPHCKFFLDSSQSN